MRIYWEKRLGCVIAGAGMAWLVHGLTQNYSGLVNLSLPPRGPIEICSIGVLIWLHAKWRLSILP